MTLRNVILAICALLFVISIVRYAIGPASWTPMLLLAIALALIVFERSRYRPQVKSNSGEWLPTGERFEDPTSGKTVVVYQNPQTGEREYRPPEADRGGRA